MVINTAISRIAHLCGQNREFLLTCLHRHTPPSVTYMHIMEIHRDNQKSEVTESNRIIHGFMLLSWWTK